MEKKFIKIPKGFFEKLKYSVKVPTIKCAICGHRILDTPTNRIENQAIINEGLKK